MKSLSDMLREIVHKGPDKDKLYEEELKGQHEGSHLGVSQKKLQGVGADEISTFATQRKTCGGCKYFDLKNGQEEMIRQQFLERLVHDERWKMHHMGADPSMIGLCGASGGETATTYVTTACDQFVPIHRLKR